MKKSKQATSIETKEKNCSSYCVQIKVTDIKDTF